MKSIKKIFAIQGITILMVVSFFLQIKAQVPGKCYIKAQLNNKCLDVQWAKNANGTPLHTWDFSGGDAQQFTIEKSNEAGYFYIKTFWGRALDAASPNAQAILHTWDFHGGDNQKWKFIDAGDGYYNIQCKQGNNYIDIKNGNKEAGAVVWLAGYSTWGNNIAQRWKLEQIGALGGVVFDPTLPRIYVLPGASDTKDGVRTNLSETPRSGAETKLGGSNTEEKPGMVCTTQKIRFSEGNFDRIIAGGIEEKIYPGAFYDAASIVKGTWQPYSIERNAMKISLVDVSAIPGNPNATVTPENSMIDGGLVRKEVQTILINNSRMRNSAANSYESKTIYSANQLKVFIGADFNGWGVQASGTFDLNKRESQNLVIYKITQKYFTINVPTQNSKELLKNPNASVNPNAVYISSVSYGRIGYLSIKSSLSSEEIKVALDAIYSDPSMKVGIRGRVDIANFLRSSEVRGFAYGGRPITITNVNDFFKYIREGDIRDNTLPPKPIFYKTKFLATGKDAFVSMTTDYNETVCEPIQTLDLTLKGVSLSGHHNNDCRRSWGTVDVEVWETENGVLSKRILPITESGTIEDVTRMMDWPNTGATRPIHEYNTQEGYLAINNVNKTWSYKINPNKVNNNEAVFIVKTYLGSQHKWSDMSTDHMGNAGMAGVETKRINILEVLNAKRNSTFDKKDGPMVAGPYRSPYRNDHVFWAHFDANAR
jgi:Thiol-activated cytolysin/Ricin-type beta-trefoil lectin domain-like